MEKVTLQDMLSAREARAQTQNILLNRYRQPLISFTLNIPGEIKTSPRLLKLFNQGLAAITEKLTDHHVPILKKIEHHAATGDECLLVCQCDAHKLKLWLTATEEEHPLGRLMDIDVLDTDGQKLSRPHPRQCFICGRPAADCARNRRHNAAELTTAIKTLLDKHLQG